MIIDRIIRLIIIYTYWFMPLCEFIFRFGKLKMTFANSTLESRITKIDA